MNPPSLPTIGLGRRLAVLFGRPEVEGDRISRRALHAAGALVLVYFLMPDGFFVVLPKEVVLLLALAALFVLEGLRLGYGARVPTIRPYEARRPASYLFYGVALVIAVLLFPEPIAVAVVLGTALVDPLAGELRTSPERQRRYPWLPFAVYAALAAPTLFLVGHWPWAPSLGLGLLAAGVGVGVERWRFRWLDDDLTMTVVPALVLYGLGVVALGLPV